MNKSEEERKTWVEGQVDKLKAARPEPEKRDALHNRIPDSRKGRQSLTVWLKPEVVRQFKTLAFQNDKSQQVMMEEALNLLFLKYNMQAIA